jgi:hypothetical protein
MVVLDDGTIVASSRPSLVAETLQVARGEGGSLATHDGLQGALPGSVDAVAAVIATDRLLAAPEPGAVPPSPVTGDALPDIELALFTLAPGGGPVRMTLVLDEATEEPGALRRAVQARIDGDPAWSARWTVEEIRVGGDGRRIEVTVTGGPVGEAALGIADPRELDPFRWADAD